MTSEDLKPPDEGGCIGTIEDSRNDTKKSSAESMTEEKSLGSSAVAVLFSFLKALELVIGRGGFCSAGMLPT